MRVLLATAGGRGDIEPVQALGVRLAEAGHEVLLTASPDFEQSSRELGLPFRAIGMNARAAITQVLKGNIEVVWPAEYAQSEFVFPAPS